MPNLVDPEPRESMSKTCLTAENYWWWWWGAIIQWQWGVHDDDRRCSSTAVTRRRRRKCWWQHWSRLRTRTLISRQAWVPRLDSNWTCSRLSATPSVRWRYSKVSQQDISVPDKPPRYHVVELYRNFITSSLLSCISSNYRTWSINILYMYIWHMLY